MGTRRQRARQAPESPSFYEALGRAVKVLRTARGLERKDLAETSGVSYPYLSEIENGTKRPSSGTLLAIAEALGVRPHELLESAETWNVEAPSSPAFAMRSATGSWFVSPTERRMGFENLAAAAAAPPADRGSRRSRRGALQAELGRLAGTMSDEDLERLIDLARRLSK